MELIDKPLSILVIEDNPGDYLLVEEFLNEMFDLPEIDQASRFSEATEQISNNADKYDAILLDLTLPDKSGEELIDEMIKISADVPIIVLTGYTDVKFSMISLSKGVSDYLLKDDLSPELLKKSILYAIGRRVSASKLLQSEKNYRVLFELSPEPMMLFDLQSYQFLDVNEAAVKKYGYTKDEFLEMTLMDIKPKDEVEESKTAIQDTVGQKHVRFEKDYKHITKSGETLLVEIHASSVDYNGRKVRMALAHDVTTKRKEEERLRLLESVITNANEYVVILEMESVKPLSHKIIYVNDAFTKITGYSADDVIGKTFDFLHGEKTSDSQINLIFDALVNNQECELEMLNYKKLGTTFWSRTSLVPVNKNKVKNRHWVAIGRDISQQKKYELQLTESLKEKNTLLSEIHHRVKNNLAVVSGMMKLQAYEENNPEVITKLNDSINRIHAMATIHELLYESGSFSKLRFSDMLEKLAQNIHTIAGQGKEIAVSITKKDVELNINQAIPASLIINEILTNVYKHAFKSSKTGQIAIGIDEINSEVIIKIEDNGVGISPKKMSVKSLGLQLVDILTQQLEGHQKIYNTGNGTAFELKFEKRDVVGAGSSL